MNKRIKTCPFCGGDAEVVEQTHGLGKYYEVICVGCEARIGQESSPDSAIEVWNYRRGSTNRGLTANDWYSLYDDLVGEYVDVKEKLEHISDIMTSNINGNKIEGA